MQKKLNFVGIFLFSLLCYS